VFKSVKYRESGNSLFYNFFNFGLGEDFQKKVKNGAEWTWEKTKDLSQEVKNCYQDPSQIPEKLKSGVGYTWDMAKELRQEGYQKGLGKIENHNDYNTL